MPTDLPLTSPARAYLIEEYVPGEERDSLFARLLAEVPFAVREIRLFGRMVAEPRCSAWVGDPSAIYTYSGATRRPEPWTPALGRLAAELQQTLGVPFNSVLCNLYRDGHDAMGLHADDEPELGSEPLIASLSLGAPRRLRFVPKKGVPAVAYQLELPAGSLLVMAGKTQALYKHGIPRQKRVLEPRINLTFRQVQSGR